MEAVLMRLFERVYAAAVIAQARSRAAERECKHDGSFPMCFACSGMYLRVP